MTVTRGTLPYPYKGVRVKGLPFLVPTKTLTRFYIGRESGRVFIRLVDIGFYIVP